VGTGRHFSLTGDTLVATVSGELPGKVTTVLLLILHILALTWFWA